MANVGIVFSSKIGDQDEIADLVRDFDSMAGECVTRSRANAIY